MRRHFLTPGCLLAALALGAGTASAAGDPQWAQTGRAYTDTLGGGQGLASRADGSLLYRGLASIPRSVLMSANQVRPSRSTVPSLICASGLKRCSS